MEKTLILIKPDGVQRGLVGDVISRFEKKGMKLVAMKMMKLSEITLKEHYSHIADKPFFPGISEFMQSSPVIAMVWEGKTVVSTVRQICGITNAREAEPGTIRGDYAMSIQCNVIHASEDLENAEKELKRFFNKEDFFDYKKDEYLNVYSKDEL